MDLLAAIANSPEKDSHYANTCLTILYTKEERLKRSVTGNKTKNTKMTDLGKKPMTPEKLKFIYGMIHTLF